MSNIDAIAQERDFALLMINNITNTIKYLFSKDQEFGVMCDVEIIGFNPELPKEISDKLDSITYFMISNYSFESASIEDNCLFFEAGFGKQNIGSVVSVPLLAIKQIVVENAVILMNIADDLELEDIEEESEGVENSMASFLSNPENADFTK